MNLASAMSGNKVDTNVSNEVIQNYLEVNLDAIKEKKFISYYCKSY